MKHLPIFAASCATCGLLPECGGQRGQQTIGGCFVGCGAACGGPEKCDWVCPLKADFVDRVREVGGLSTGSTLIPTGQTVNLPRYIPMIRHGSSRAMPLDVAAVALSIEDVVKHRGQSYSAIATSASGIREQFALRHDAQVVLVSVARDRVLERFWAYRRKWFVPRQFKDLGLTAITVPNFSSFLDAPRPHSLWNRRRMEIVASEFAANGLFVVPHLNSLQEDDWRHWQVFLGAHDHLTYVAKEFQTGLRLRDRGDRAIADLARLQDRVGRALHPVIVGGAAFAAELARHFTALTFVDSQPFMKAIKRRRAAAPGRWERSELTNVDQLLALNIQAHEAHIAREIARGSAGQVTTPRRRGSPRRPNSSSWANRLPQLPYRR
ncbi:MAG TPA: DUF4417 domain-containing protein [Candidatus Paceibacterota bacterium]|nr:DUF4417 domain-containing protein [Candidatus Paceibacterota bacterium]